MDPKLAMLFALVGVIIALSHLDDARLTRTRRRLAVWRRRRPATTTPKS
ncbi:MAG: hypothetical protein AB7O50_12270 [Pseudolabrys sp.]